MGYCALADILDLMDERTVIRYTDDDGDGVPDSGVIDGIIGKATALIDSHIAERYGTGLDPVPDLISSLAVDICIYKIASRRKDAPDDIRTNYEDALRMLGKISTGKAHIPGLEVHAETATANTAAAVVTRSKHFTADGLEGF